ncbi:patatin-like phospholipase family protein [Cyanobium sp. CH-040]|uniref:patatin-like phospholipase family protein n=1 Tax=Cyanobium sp. CH-040 TaxID=2823708 RepID=UPI0020CD96A9|nr:patatin-like phospholipase family protein [Cyanobium sp. CH-040]MCP9927687.1 patatin-like phospholipase family protein [Cyanobium sp. CH-040]
MAEQGATATVPVTLNCSGGIALGAYMAGVFSELVKSALRDRAQGKGPAIRIDTITGASAGAMTAMIAARYLLQDPPAALAQLKDDDGEEQPRNGFHRAWVQRADIGALTSYSAELDGYFSEDPDLPRWPRLGLLSGTSIAGITEEVAGGWTASDLTGMRKALTRNPLAVLMTVTNLQGLLARPQTAGNGDDPWTVSHGETRRFLFHRDMAELKVNDAAALSRRWDKAKASARASGAFPVAFPPLSDISQASSPNIALKGEALEMYWAAAQEQRHDPDWICRVMDPAPAQGSSGPLPDASRLRLRFDYTDGGVLDGLPILEGLDLLNAIDRINAAEAQGSADRQQGQPAQPAQPAKGGVAREDDQELHDFALAWGNAPPQEELRRYLYVQPIPVTGLKAPRSLLRRFFPLLANGLAGLTYPKAEHDHRRLREIEEINRLVRCRDDLIAESSTSPEEEARLRQVLPYRHVTLDPIHPVLPFRPGPFASLLLEVAREVRAEMAATGSRADEEPAADASEGAVLAAFETMLLGGSQVKPEEPLSAAELLASDFLFAFGGFFHPDYRRHDYLIGRLSALAWLLNAGLVDEGTIRPELTSLLRGSRGDYLPSNRRGGLQLLIDGPRLLQLIVRRLPYVLVSDGFRKVFIPYAGRWAYRWHAVLRVLIAPLTSLVAGVALLVAGVLVLPLVVVVGGLWLLARLFGPVQPGSSRIS